MVFTRPGKHRKSELENGVLMGCMILYDGDSMGFNGGLIEFPK